VVEVRSPGVRLRLPPGLSAVLPADSGAVVAGIRPEHLRLVSDSAVETEPGTVRGVVDIIEPLGSEQHVMVDVDGCVLVARLPRGDRVRTGQKVTLAVASDSVHVFDADNGVAYRKAPVA
jgi:multiple sugar transport system ATP-binding protein